MFGANSADVEVGIASPTQSCSQWVQDLAGSGLVWYPITALAVPGSQGSADSDTMQETCDLTDGSQELYVEDGGGMDYGDSICNSEERNGWSPEGTPGPLASQAQSAQQAAAQASASAAAAQASASSVAASAQAQQQAVTTASNDDTQLNHDAGQLGTDYASWSKDMATAGTDYQKLLSEPVCQGGASDQNTYDDAQNVYDDGQNVYSDEQTMSSDLSTVQGDISSLQSADSAAGTDHGGDISKAKAIVSKAQAAVSADNSSKIQNEAEAVQAKVNACGT